MDRTDASIEIPTKIKLTIVASKNAVPALVSVSQDFIHVVPSPPIKPRPIEKQDRIREIAPQIRLLVHFMGTVLLICVSL